MKTMDPKEVESSTVWQWAFGNLGQSDGRHDGSRCCIKHHRSIAPAF